VDFSSTKDGKTVKNVNCIVIRMMNAPCLWCRIRARGYSVVRFPRSVARYRMISHDADRRNPYNIRRYHFFLVAVLSVLL